MKKILFILLILAAVLVIAGCKTTTDDPATSGETGTVYFAISDPGFMEGITSVEITVTGISVKDSDGEWTTITTEPSTYDLVELDVAQAIELIEETEIIEGTYTEIRLEIGQVKVMKNNEEQDAVLPSNRLMIKSQFTVKAGEPTLLEFQFLGGESLHETGEGKMIMTPVMNMHRYENAEVEMGEQNRIRVTTQARKQTEQFGMNLEGTMEKGKKIGLAEELEVGENGKVVKKGIPEDAGTGDSGQGSGEGQMQGTGNVVFTITDAQDELDVTSLEITIEKLEVHKSVSARNGTNESEENEGEWITIFEEEKTYELLELVDVEALLGEATLEAGHYTQIRLYVTAATAIVDGETVSVIVPSNALKIVRAFDVIGDETTVVSIDFIPGKSLHKTGNGIYRLKPTIKMTVYKGAEIEIGDEEVEDVDDDNETEEPECTAGWFCIDDMTAAYETDNCTIINTTMCDYMCEDGACIDDPTPTNTTNETTLTCTAAWNCVDSTRIYQEEDCSWREDDSVYCTYGCLDGECKAKPRKIKLISAVEIPTYDSKTVSGELDATEI
ncbi:MAG: DUF4382 domain-containing protein [archaeon]